MTVFTHFDGNDRHVLQTGLERGDSFAKIAEALGKHPTSVANEVKKYRSFRKSGGMGSCFNDCKNRFTCKKTDLCDAPQCRKKYCRHCARCSEHCSDYEQERCLKLDKPPYVCSRCKNRNICTMEKAFYDACAANEAASRLLHESRSGINADESEVARWNATITPLVQHGQSLYHIKTTVAGAANLPPLRTLYSYVEKKVFPGICSVDLPRKVKYHKRDTTNKAKTTAKADRHCRDNRRYQDYLEFMKEHPDISIVQMDTVVDTSQQNSLLTLHFVESSLMLAYLRKGNIAEDVATTFDLLTDTLGLEAFRSLFPVILTDNGTEFSDPARLEMTRDGQQRTKIFFCDPNASFQKGAIENNHELIRRVLPKGTSFAEITQNGVMKMMSHINSYKRQKLNGRSPYDMFSFLHGPGGDALLRAFGIRKIKAEKIILLPSLLRYK